MHYKANRKEYICGAYNKNGQTKWSDHHVREHVLIEAISNDIKQVFSALSTKTI